MLYKEALEKSYEALKEAKNPLLQAIPLPLIYAFIIGGGVGFIIAFIFSKRKKNEVKYCAYCGNKLE